MLTQTEIAAHLDVSQSAISDMIRRKVFPRPHRGPECTLDLYRVAYIRHLREVAAGRASVDGTLDLVAERARLASEQADAQAMTNSVRRGELIEIAKVCGALEEDLSRVRTRLLAIPSEQAAALVRHRTPLALQEALRDVIIDVLTELSAPRDYGKPKKASNA